MNLRHTLLTGAAALVVASQLGGLHYLANDIPPAVRDDVTRPVVDYLWEVQ